MINGKYYFGKSGYDSDKNPEYLGSGKILKRAVKKYGRDNFIKEIIEDNITCTDKLNELEIFHISENFGENCYNIARGGEGGNSLKYYSEEKLAQYKEKMSKLVSGKNNPFYGKSHSRETKEKISKAKMGSTYSDEFKAKCSKRMIGNTINLGRVHSEETKAKQSANNSGKGNPMYGKHHNPETIDLISRRIRESTLIKILCEHCGKAIDKGNYTRWHGDNCKLNPDITKTQLESRSPWNKKSPETISEESTLK